MKSSVSIRALYPLAMSEGEGVGTAYEYFVKRLILSAWLKTDSLTDRMLIAGLPEKYGASLDFLLLADELKLPVVIADDRPQALEKAQKARDLASAAGLLSSVQPNYIVTRDLAELVELGSSFELCISSEVMQRLPPTRRSRYWRRLQVLAPMSAVFVPNADNSAHASLSGLSGLRIEELQKIVTDNTSFSAGAECSVQMDYIDMPPFPPGATRTEEQREQATSGRLEAFAMWGLGYFAKIERLLPLTIRRSQAHIVYALARRV